MTPEYLFRYESVRYSCVIDAELELYGVTPAKLRIDKYRVTKETPKGYWIGLFETDRWKWVSKESKKRFAHPTEEEALEAYRQRKLAYVRHCNARLNRAKEDLKLVEGKIL